MTYMWTDFHHDQFLFPAFFLSLFLTITNGGVSGETGPQGIPPTPFSSTTSLKNRITNYEAAPSRRSILNTVQQMPDQRHHCKSSSTSKDFPSLRPSTSRHYAHFWKTRSRQVSPFILKNLISAQSRLCPPEGGFPAMEACPLNSFLKTVDLPK